MGKKTIVIASILKPVDDPRMYERFAFSLVETNKYQVKIIGFPSTVESSHQDIEFISLPRFKRLSLTRLLIPLIILRKVLKINPALFILNTWELLGAGFWARVIRKVPMVYDVRENYALNIHHSASLPYFLRILISPLVRLQEWIMTPFVRSIIFAEENYTSELEFMNKKAAVVRNKYKGEEQAVHTPGERTQLVYTGTIGRDYGIFEAVDLVTELHRIDPRFRLTIAGFAPHKRTWKELERRTRGLDFIKIIGGDRWVPHQEIMSYIANANMAILPYRLTPPIRNCFPTRIYEYASYELPMILTDNPRWNPFIQKYNCGVVVDFDRYEPHLVIDQIISGEFYNTGAKPEVLWKDEEPALLEQIEKSLSS